MADREVSKVEEIRDLGDGVLTIHTRCGIVSATGALSGGTVKLEWNADDPHALYMAAVSSTGSVVMGEFAIDLLAMALAAPGKHFGQPWGSVMVTSDKHSVSIDVVSNERDKTATVAIRPDGLRGFIKVCRQRAGDAADRADVYIASLDDELAQLIEGEK